MSSRPHVLVVSYPAQGHVNPLMDLSRIMAERGFKITFVNTEFTNNRIRSAMEADMNDSLLGDRIRLVSIPDGLGPEEDRSDFNKLSESILRDMPCKLEELIQSINGSDGNTDEMITCVVADLFMGWALEVAAKMGIRSALFWIGSATTFALKLSIPWLIHEGIIDGDGFPTRKKMIKLSPSMPVMDPANIPWSCCSNDLALQKTCFENVVRCTQLAENIADWWLCNTTYELEPAAFSLFPKLLPIGPLRASNQIGNSGAQFWPEDSTCQNWLDHQPPRSVIYVALGSLSVLDRTQFEELACGLELSSRPFLCVVRPGITKGQTQAYPNGFLGTHQGKIVDWAPQKRVLSHPAIACFLSHCGWNSVMEGLSNGVPFLCWPQFTDQFLNHAYVCDVWKVGLRLDRDENGIIRREEFKKKVEQVLDDEKLRARSLDLKEMAINNMTDGGRSPNNLNDFIGWLKA